MFTQAIQPGALRAIQLVSKLDPFKQAYLAGGTALALQLGHRMSQDLDFFTPDEFDERIMSSELSRLPEFTEESLGRRTVLGKIGPTKFSIFYYKTKLLDPLEHFEGINILQSRDIAAMKLHAITQRGVRRDFVDLYFLAKQYSLEEMFGFYNQKYGILEDKLYHILKGMNYFVEADIDSMPKMLIKTDWPEIKDFFNREATRLASTKLDL